VGFIFLARTDLGQAAELFQQSLREAWQAEECSGHGWALVGSLSHTRLLKKKSHRPSIY
jgi:hypothetical protein